MRRQLVILLVLFSVFLAIGCTDTGNDDAEDEGNQGGPEASQGAEDQPGADESGANERPVTPAETIESPSEETIAPNPERTPEIPGSGENIEVAIENDNFNPSTVTISTGDSVRWTNLDPHTHTVTGTGTNFGSETLNQGDSYEFLFTEEGNFEYYCSIHPSMKGTVIVTED